MSNRKQYRLAVEGKRNYTPVGPVFETPFDAREAAPRINKERERAGLKPVVALKQYSAGRWHFLYYLALSVLFGLVTVTATAQERPARTWATIGATLTKSTAEDSAPAIAGLDIRLAYDLRRGLQVIGEGEYRNRPAIRHLFTGDFPNRAQSEMQYGARLVYHFPVEGRVRPYVGGGVSAIRHFLDNPYGPSPGDVLYNSSVNPVIAVGVELGRRSELTVTRYLADTYSYSNLRGWGVDFVNTRPVFKHLNLRSGLRFKRWSFYEGQERYSERAVEVGGFVGFQFQ